MDWHLVLSSLTFAISGASLLVSRHAWTIAEEAKGKARHSLRVSVYSVEVNRKRLGIPYDHDVVEQYEANEGIFASMGVGSYKGRRCKDSDGIVQSDDAVQVFSDGTYRIVPRVRTSMVLLPRSGTAYIDTGEDALEMIPNARQALASSDRVQCRDSNRGAV